MLNQLNEQISYLRTSLQGQIDSLNATINEQRDELLRQSEKI